MALSRRYAPAKRQWLSSNNTREIMGRRVKLRTPYGSPIRRMTCRLMCPVRWGAKLPLTKDRRSRPCWMTNRLLRLATKRCTLQLNIVMSARASSRRYNMACRHRGRCQATSWSSLRRLASLPTVRVSNMAPRRYLYVNMNLRWTTRDRLPR